MTKIKFRAPEYQHDGAFKEREFEFEGDEKSGWTIRRDGQTIYTLASGYTPVQSYYCGVCSTDLARKFLPYPLPQIIGHEVVGKKDGKMVVVEINASLRARGVIDPENPYSQGSMHVHDPRRITLGINRLSGGFAPVFLAPVDAIIPLPSEINPLVASLTEPFAAALQGVEATFPRQGERVAVLGPRRLGSLIIAALAGFRQQQGIDFEICAIARHPHLLEVCQTLGADRAIDLQQIPIEQLKNKFDVVFDTTGKPEGFALALDLARRAVHLKSTHGQKVLGLQHLTDMVVDEIALLPAKPENFNFTWEIEAKERKNPNIYVAEDIPNSAVARLLSEVVENRQFHRISIEAAINKIQNNDLKGSPFPRFDLAIAGSLSTVDRILRPIAGEEFSLVRPRGAIMLFARDRAANSPLYQAVCDRHLEIHSSRCGNFRRALNILQQNPAIRVALEKNLITHRYSLNDIASAFEIAGDSSKSIKVIVETSRFFDEDKY